jgi:hypothetical protein
MNASDATGGDVKYVFQSRGPPKNLVRALFY